MDRVKGVKQTGNVLLVIILLIAALGVAGWYGLRKTTAPTTSSTGQKSSANTQPSSSGTPEDLTFTGAVSGHMIQGRKGATYACVPIATGPIIGKIGDTDYTFEYRALNAKGPGPVKGYVQIGPVNNKDLYYGGDNVDLTINADKRSGSVNGDLSNLKNSAQTVHISGNWTCPPDY